MKAHENDYTMDGEGKMVMSPLKKLDCKTGFFGGQAGVIYGSWSGGRCRILGGEDGSFCYHVMSRTAGGDKLFGDEEKEGFRKVMRLMERFSGVQVLTYAVMDNHFHVLARVPAKRQFLKRFENSEESQNYLESCQGHWLEGAQDSGEDGKKNGAAAESERVFLMDGEENLLEHLLILYTEAYVKQVRREIMSMRQKGQEEDIEKFLNKYKKRFCDLSLFVKELKERFSRWFNKKNDRRGTLWMDRFKSVLVEDGESLRTISAYIDLNAVRAGIVEDPKDYRWCGYAEAVAGSKRARRGLCQVMEVPQDSWSSKGFNQSGKRGSGAWYRCWLMTDGEEVVVDETNQNYHVKAKVGIPKEKVEESLAMGGLLTTPELLRCKIRYFTEGLAIGSKGFVEKWYGKNRLHFSPNREKGAKRIPNIKNTPQTTTRKKTSLEPVESAFYTLKGILKVKKE